MTDEQIFSVAIETPANQREGYLAEACADDEQRHRIEALLLAHSQHDSLLDADDLPTTVGPGGRVQPELTIDRYKLREQIGEGGMGVVYVAEQEQPVRRKVALKIIKAGMDTKDVIARFEAERQALALMDHPNIAKVLDAGSTESGRPYFAMELVRGIPITTYCDEKKLPVRDRLELFVQVCHAIQHAHQKGIIHRDIKPSNVLVTEHDGTPVPKVIDFGVAKAIGQKLTEHTVYTHHLQPVGTLLYMSPEQSRLSGLDIDTRSDVYALGLLLYELLTGTLPFDVDTFNGATFDEKRRIIAEEEVPRPSTRVTALGDSTKDVITTRQTSVDGLRRTLRGELDWILVKSLEKDRNRRYETADRFAEDVQSFLDGEIVRARPPSVAYRLERAWRRNRTALAIITLLFVGFAVAASGWYRASQLAEENQKTLSVVTDYTMLLASRGNDNDTQLAVNISRLSGETDVWCSMLQAQSAITLGDYETAIDVLDRAHRNQSDPHHLSCKGLLAYAYIVAGNTDRYLPLIEELESSRPTTATEKIFVGRGVLMDSSAWWKLADAALDERDSPLARFNRASAAHHFALEVHDLSIVKAGLDDMTEVHRWVDDTPDQVATTLQLLLAGRLLKQEKGIPSDDWHDAALEELSKLKQWPESALGLLVTAWYFDAFGTEQEADDAWHEVLEHGGGGWHDIHAAAMLYRRREFDAARALLQGEETLEQIGLAMVLAREPAHHPECRAIYDRLAARGGHSSFRLGMPIEILLSIGDLQLLRQESENFLKARHFHTDFDQMLLEFLGDQRNLEYVQTRLSQFSKTEQLMAHFAIARWALANDPPKTELAVEQLQKTIQTCVFHTGDFYWAKAYLETVDQPVQDLSADP